MCQSHLNTNSMTTLKKSINTLKFQKFLLIILIKQAHYFLILSIPRNLTVLKFQENYTRVHVIYIPLPGLSISLKVKITFKNSRRHLGDNLLSLLLAVARQYVAANHKVGGGKVGAGCCLIFKTLLYSLKPSAH